MDSLTFRQIEVFLEVCRAGNFSGAAATLRDLTAGDQQRRSQRSNLNSA